MKCFRKALCIVLAVIVAVLPVKAANENTGIMIEAAMNGDREAGTAAEGTVKWDDLFLLSRALFCITGYRTFEDELRLCMGEVILNRVSSPEFPDTLAEVIAADTAYCGVVPGYFEALRPDRSCAECAYRLLSGERVMDDPLVVWQNCHYYDGGVVKSLYDYRVGAVHFCRSANPGLYGTGA